MIYQTYEIGTANKLDSAPRPTDVLGDTLRNLYRRCRLNNNLVGRWLSALQTAPKNSVSSRA